LQGQLNDARRALTKTQTDFRKQLQQLREDAEVSAKLISDLEQNVLNSRNLTNSVFGLSDDARNLLRTVAITGSLDLNEMVLKNSEASRWYTELNLAGLVGASGAILKMSPLGRN
jgi:hypothetical protein